MIGSLSFAAVGPLPPRLKHYLGFGFELAVRTRLSACVPAAKAFVRKDNEKKKNPTVGLTTGGKHLQGRGPDRPNADTFSKIRGPASKWESAPC